MSQLEEGQAPDGSVRKRAISVKAKLRNAFIGIAAFSLLAAIAGVVSHQTVEIAQKIRESNLDLLREMYTLLFNTSSK